MKYEVKGLTSYGVYDGDRLLRTYESEKAATLVAEALNEETERDVVRVKTSDDTIHQYGEASVETLDDGSLSGASAFYADQFRRTNIPATDSDFGQGGLAGLSNGQDKETI